jgi:hypothetical protein
MDFPRRRNSLDIVEGPILEARFMRCSNNSDFTTDFAAFHRDDLYPDIDNILTLGPTKAVREFARLKIDWAARFAPTERFVIPSKNRETTD